MPSGDEDTADLSAEFAAPSTDVRAKTGGEEHHDHHLLIDAEEDRWKWRAKIRRDPRKLFFYRMGVGVAGGLMLILAAITGPLPGPGGIPLALVGLAIWASEFEWALKVMMWFKALLARLRSWPRSRKIGSIALACLIGVLCFYLSLLVMGVPHWAPEFVRHGLHQLPGVRPPR